MSLLEEVQAAVNTLGNYPADEIAGEVEELSASGIPVEVVEDRDTGAYSRWSNVNRAILRRGDEHVAVVYHEPATENQGWSDWSANEVQVYTVVPVEVTTVEYRHPNA